MQPFSLSTSQTITFVSYTESLHVLKHSNNNNNNNNNTKTNNSNNTLTTQISMRLSSGSTESDSSACVDTSFESNNSAFDEQIKLTMEANAPPLSKYQSEYPYLYYHYIISLGEDWSSSSRMEVKETIRCCFCSYTHYMTDDEGYLTMDSEHFSNGLSITSRKAIDALAVHLMSFHSDFTYAYYIDQYKNIHIIVSTPNDVNSTIPIVSTSSTITSARDIQIVKQSIVVLECGVLVSNIGKKRKYLGRLTNGFIQQKQFSFVNILTHSQIARKRKQKPTFFRLDEGHYPDTSIHTSRSSNHKKYIPRQYYHPRIGLPLMNIEVDVDSDKDIDQAPMLQQNNRLLDEFEDVSFEEKEFMKLWNMYVEYKYIFTFKKYKYCVIFRLYTIYNAYI
jgi:hypothetical protein